VLFERPADQEVPAEEVQLSLARLYLADAVRIVLRNLLTDIFGISAPESM
jgi:arginyl-tRNA synthetase